MRTLYEVFPEIKAFGCCHEVFGTQKLLAAMLKDMCGIEDVARAMEPMFTTGGEERSGMGFTIMQSFTDKVTVTSKPGKGTVVKLRKRIRGKL